VLIVEFKHCSSSENYTPLSWERFAISSAPLDTVQYSFTS